MCSEALIWLFSPAWDAGVVTCADVKYLVYSVTASAEQARGPSRWQTISCCQPECRAAPRLCLVRPGPGRAPGQRRHLQMRKLRQPIRWQPHRRARHLHDSGLSPYAQRRGIRAATASRTSFDADVYPRGCAPFPSCPPRPHLRPHSHFCSFVESLSAPAGVFSLQSRFYLSLPSSLSPLLHPCWGCPSSPPLPCLAESLNSHGHSGLK